MKRRSPKPIRAKATRHCERSEAIQGAPTPTGLLRRYAPRNDGWELLNLRWLQLAVDDLVGELAVEFGQMVELRLVRGQTLA